jgi:hypothetical protein
MPVPASTSAPRAGDGTSPPPKRTPTGLTPGCAARANANAQLKTWRVLRKLRCCPWRAGQLAKAIHVLQAREIPG